MLFAVICALAGIVLVSTLVSMRNQPHIRRIAFRNLLVHKSSALLSILGLTIATSLITMTFIVYSSTTQNTEQYIADHFGKVQSEMTATEQKALAHPYFEHEDVTNVANLVRRYNRNINMLPITSVKLTLIRPDANGDPLLLSPDTYVYGFDPLAAYRFDPESARSVPELNADEIIISDKTAQFLKVDKGSLITVPGVKGAMLQLTVRDVLPEKGFPGFRGPSEANTTAIVSLSTACTLAGVPSNGYTSILLSDHVELGDPWYVLNSRHKTFTAINEGSSWLVVLIGMISAVSTAIGIVLISQIFKLLADERRVELGILRAIGMSRNNMARTLRLEGLIYAVLSGTFGIGLGSALAWLLLASVKLDVEYSFYAGPDTLLAAFSTGLLLVYACIWRISAKATRASIVSALRPARSDAETIPGTSVRHLIAYCSASILVCSAVLLLSVGSVKKALISQVESSPILLLGSVLFFTVILVYVFTHSIGLFYRVVQLLSRKYSSVAFMFQLAFRNLEAQRGRTAKFIVMFSLVFAIVGFSAVITSNASKIYKDSVDTPKALAGFDLMATTRRSIDSDELLQLVSRSKYVDSGKFQSIAAVAQLHLKTVYELYLSKALMYYGIDSAFAQTIEIPLVSFDRSFKNERSVWEEASNNPDVVVISQFAHAQTGFQYGIGDLLPIQIDTETVHKKIIGIAAEQTTVEFPVTYGIWLKRSELMKFAAAQEIAGSVLLFQLRPDEDLETAAAQLEKELMLQNSYPVIVPAKSGKHYLGTMETMFQLYTLFGFIASVIGLAGLMIVLIRAGRERRRQMGTLRAIGVHFRVIYWSVLIEGGFTSIFGVAFGLAIGSYVGSLILMSVISTVSENAVPYFPWLELGIVFLIAVFITLCCVSFPAQRSKQTRPTEATRYMD